LLKVPLILNSGLKGIHLNLNQTNPQKYSKWSSSLEAS